MGFEQYAVPTPSPVARYGQAFTENRERRRRFLITGLTGQHLIGIPWTASPFDLASPEVSFYFRTATQDYKLPFAELAFAEELVAEVGAPTLTGMPQFPEPCRGPEFREKQQKFRILDVPGLLAEDLRSPMSLFGRVVLYLDIDNFKPFNAKYDERVIDNTVLPAFQSMVAKASLGHGFAYAEGGDEVIVLLLNATQAMGAAFAESLRSTIEATRFEVEGNRECITISIGLSASSRQENAQELANYANSAKNLAKRNGRNRVEVCSPDLPRTP